TGVNWERDVGGAIPADLRNVVEGDPSPTGAGRLKIARGIEVGHSFQLGRKYSEPMKALVLDEAGRETALYMGCYGIGVTRIVAAAIEQNHDERGIIWPAPIAPFQVVLVSLNLQKSARVREVSDRLYAELTAAGIEVLYDARSRVTVVVQHLDSGGGELGIQAESRCCTTTVTRERASSSPTPSC